MADREDPWKAHELEQRRGWLALSPAQRLAWLWQAKLFRERARHATRMPVTPPKR
jgi:hypothetical protein